MSYSVLGVVLRYSSRWDELANDNSPLLLVSGKREPSLGEGEAAGKSRNIRRYPAHASIQLVADHHFRQSSDDHN